MERDRVEEAIALLEAEGRTVSANAIVELIGGSKRDVLAHLKELRALAGVGTGLNEPDEDAEPSEEERYREDIAQLDAALQAAENRADQAEQALWTQAQHYAKVQAIDAAGGFRLARYAQPDRWTNTPKTEKEAMERRIAARTHALADIEKAHAAIRQRQVQWDAACWEAAFLATPESQYITHQLKEALAALEAAKASNQSDMVGVLARRRDSLEKQLDAARLERRLSQDLAMRRQAYLSMAEADRLERQKRGV